MPDIFGNPTPLEAQMMVQEAFRKRRQEFANSAMAQSSGAQAGQALANIFAPMIRRTLDTRSARKEEMERLMREDAQLTKDEAKAIAKERIKPEFREVRRAKRMQNTIAALPEIRQASIDEGNSYIVADTAAKLELANRMIDQGFVSEGQKIRQTAMEEFKAEQLRVAELENLESRTAETRASTMQKQLDSATDSDLYINLNDPDNIQFEEVSRTNVERHQEFQTPGSGWMKLHPGVASVVFDEDTITGRKTPTNETMESVNAWMSTLRGLDTMEAAAQYAGFEGPVPKGLFNFFRGKFGFGPDELVDAVAVEEKMAADVQSLVKGIPSNYDAKIFERLIPRLGAVKSARVYQAKIDLLREHTATSIEMAIAFHKGTDKEIPPHILDAAAALGVNTQQVEAWDDAGDQDRVNAKYKALENQIAADLAALDEEDNAAAESNEAGSSPDNPIVLDF